VKLALAQLNPTVGDLRGNAERIVAWAERARARGAELALFPELALTGYPPHDLLERADFLSTVQAQLEQVRGRLDGVTVVLGAPVPTPSPYDKPLYNAAVALRDGARLATVPKRLLPSYDVFDERRHFAAGPAGAPLALAGRVVGLTVCEDVWNDAASTERPYEADPAAELVARGAELLLNVSASPFSRAKIAERDALLAGLARKHGVPVAMANQVGANAELVFDGSSRVFGPDGRCWLALPAFEEALGVVDLDTPAPQPLETPEEIEQIRRALDLGLRDYDRKTGAFQRAVVGLSGGVDSSLVAALAAEAFGPERVWGVSLPSRHSSQGSRDDARQLAENLGIEFKTVELEASFKGLESALAPLFAGTVPGVAEENLQARTRGTLLMALANKFSGIALACGNKSELAVGYATLYGDMAGGLAPLGDLYKTEVYALARHLNARAEHELIPEAVLTKAPSAELRPDQKDTDSLPPYDMLDDVLRRYLERGASVPEIAAAGHDPALVREVLQMVDRAEHKRRQAPPILRVSPKAFGSGRRFPLAQRWSERRGTVD